MMRVGAYPDIAAYRAAGGYGDGLEGEDLIEAVEYAELRGRGGAGFPMGVKLRSVRDRSGPRFAVVNDEEGEPASFKDRWLLLMRPHLVLDGLIRSSLAVGTERAYVYVSDPDAAESVRTALEELGETPVPVPVPVEMVKVGKAYVAGKTSSVVRWIDGGPAKPTDKPPFPFDAGVDGKPTLIANVETLANIPLIARFGGAEYRTLGEGPHGTGALLMTISGAVERPGLYEVPFGVELGPALDSIAGLPDDWRGYVMGSYFAGVVNRRASEFAVSYGEMASEGSGLGCGAVIVLGYDDCPVSAAGDVMGYLAVENAGHCGACINGTPAMAKVVGALSEGTATREDLDRLERWSHTLRGRGACGLLDAACNMAVPCDRCARIAAERDPDVISRFSLSWEGFIDQPAAKGDHP